MPKIKYKFADKTNCEVEASDEFYSQFLIIKKKYDLIERKETRRHQSLDKSLEHGFDVPDRRVNIEREIERKETITELHNAIKPLTGKQRIILISYSVSGFSFSEISGKLGISKEMVRKHYSAAINKMKKFLRQ